VAVAVILAKERPVSGVQDSKLVAPAHREELARAITDRAVSVGVGVAGSGEVDRLNILKATHAAMTRALEALSPPPDHLLIDAVRIPGLDLPQVSLVKGDQLSVSIAAASIVAKVVRDRLMRYYAGVFPGFGFDANKGYGTPGHLEAIARMGASPIHRRTFRGVWDQLPLGFSG
jgi:ribonuclease HII